MGAEHGSAVGPESPRRAKTIAAETRNGVQFREDGQKDVDRSAIPRRPSAFRDAYRAPSRPVRFAATRRLPAILGKLFVTTGQPAAYAARNLKQPSPVTGNLEPSARMSPPSRPLTSRTVAAPRSSRNRKGSPAGQTTFVPVLG